MDAVVVAGWIAIGAGVIALLAGLHTLLGELMFRAVWKWGDARKLKRSAKLGWNIGMPPEGKRFLVLEYIGDLAKNPERWSEHRWAVMTRSGDYCHTANSGFTTPATNVTGWLEIVD